MFKLSSVTVNGVFPNISLWNCLSLFFFFFLALPIWTTWKSWTSVITKLCLWGLGFSGASQDSDSFIYKTTD